MSIKPYSRREVPQLIAPNFLGVDRIWSDHCDPFVGDYFIIDDVPTEEEIKLAEKYNKKICVYVDISRYTITQFMLRYMKRIAEEYEIMIIFDDIDFVEFKKSCVESTEKLDIYDEL